MIRRLFWLLFAFSLVGSVVCALALLASPSEEVASWSGWTFMDISRVRWLWLQYGLGFLLGISGLMCLMLASRRVMADDRSPVGPAWLAAMAVFAVFVLASLLGLPPAGTLAQTSTKIKAWHAQSFGQPPLPGAEDMSLADLAKGLGFDQTKALANLTSHNVKVADPRATLTEIAQANGLAPAAVYETMRQGEDAARPGPKLAQEQAAQAPQGLPADPPPGLGRLKLSDICEQYGLNLKTEQEKLAKAGIKCSPDMTLRQIALDNLLLPIEIYDAMRGQTLAAQPQPQPQPQPQFQTPSAPEAQAPPQAAPQAGTAPQPPLPGAPQAQAQTPPPPAQAPAMDVAELSKMTLGAYCKQYDLDQTQALAKLKAKGIVAFSDMTFRELSLENGLSPEQLLKTITP